MVVGFFIMSFVSSIFSYFSSYYFVLIFVVVVAGFIYLFLKGAYFIFFNKLWSFLHRDEFYDSYLDSERKNTLDVERFKIMFGMNRIDDIQTVRDAHRAIKWSSSRSIALRALGKAGSWVDWKEQRVDKPDAFRMGFLYLFLVIVVFLSVPFAILSFNSEAIIQFKESKVWAWQGDQGVRSFLASRGGGWKYDVSSCSQSDVLAELPIHQDEIDFICSSVDSGVYFSNLKSTVKFQRYFGFPILIYLLFLSMLLLRTLSSWSAALRLHREMYPCHCKK